MKHNEQENLKEEDQPPGSSQKLTKVVMWRNRTFKSLKMGLLEALCHTWTRLTLSTGWVFSPLGISAVQLIGFS